jgi:IclR family transcriptional regulator, KDG regulon repressor
MIQLIERIVHILDFVAEASVPVRLPEIADATGLGRATCANIVSSLSKSGLLEKRGNRRQFEYVIGPKIYHYSAVSVAWAGLKRAAAPLVDELALKTTASCILAVLDGEERVVIHEAKPQSRLQVRHHERILAYASDMGHFLLSHLNDSEIDEFIQRYGLPDSGGWSGMADAEELKKKLRQIRENGSKPVTNPDHLVTLFAPISVDRNIIAALGAYLPRTNDDPEWLRQVEMHFSRVTSKIIAACEGPRL